jgi:hypothetical protein
MGTIGKLLEAILGSDFIAGAASLPVETGVATC